MKCLTPPSALDGECGFLAANLYAKSVFGEDALVNVSVEKGLDGKLAGYIRIRWASLTCMHSLLHFADIVCMRFHLGASASIVAQGVHHVPLDPARRLLKM